MALFLSINLSLAEIIKSIVVKGNKRIPNETIIMFAKIQSINNVNEDDLNRILKDLYDTNFFKNVSINLDQDVLNIFVEENPLIENIEYNGIKSKTLLNEITKNLSLKARSSYSDILFRNDKNKIISKLKNTE